LYIDGWRIEGQVDEKSITIKTYISYYVFFHSSLTTVLAKQSTARCHGAAEPIRIQIPARNLISPLLMAVDTRYPIWEIVREN
jgi:hypothetical protein